jgi:hypothetical protein
MKARLILWTALFFAYVLAAAAIADEPSPVPPQSARPKTNQPGPVRPPFAQADPRLEHILAEWERAASEIRRRDCTFARFKYDTTFDVERRGTGSLAIDDEGRAAYKIMPASIAAGQVSRRIDRGGMPYKLELDACERWHWTGKNVIRVNESDRTFEELTIPAAGAGKSVTPVDPVTDDFRPDPPPLPEDEQPSPELPKSNDGPSDNDLALCKTPIPLTEKTNPAGKEKAPTLSEWFAGVVFGIALVSALSHADPEAWAQAPMFPLPRAFLFGTRVDELKQQFRIKLLKENEIEAWLQFEPRVNNCQFNRAILILSTRDYKPSAIKLVDELGGETVHILSDVKNHLRGHVVAAPRLDRPNLNGYRQISNGGQ